MPRWHGWRELILEATAKELGCGEGQALDAAFGKIVPPRVGQAKGAVKDRP